jgi:macrolide transport system ATP-binding/permease protein
MTMFAWLKNSSRNLFRKQRADQDLDNEVRGYVEMIAEEKMSAGMNPEEARRAARIEAGGVEQVKESVRDIRAGIWLETLLQDLRYAARMLRKNPGFTAIAVLTLGLGIGANTAIFSFIDAILYKPLPVQSPEQLVDLYNSEGKNVTEINYMPLSFPDYQDLRDQNHSLSSVLAYSDTLVAIQGAEESRIVGAEAVTENYFETLGVKPFLGRAFDPSTKHAPGDDPEVVLSYTMWQRTFAADPNVVGRTLVINATSMTVVGVAPSDFFGAFRGISPDLWLPLSMDAALHLYDPMDDRGSNWLLSLGRLKPEVTVAQAQAELATIAAQLEKEYPKSNKDRSIKIFPANQVKFQPDLDTTVSATSYVLLGLVGLVLLIACANLAGMLLARAAGRSKEIAVRMALGAGRLRLIRQMLTESLLLSFLGGLCALLLTVAFNRALTRLLEGINLPVPIHIALGLDVNARVLGYTIAMVVGTTLLFGMFPALRASRGAIPSAMNEQGRSSTGSRKKHRTLNVLVVSQIAISLLLLICAGLSFRSLRNAYRVSPGFDPAGVATATFIPSRNGYTRTQIDSFYRQLGDRIRALPGVSSLAFAASLPLNLTIQVAACAPQGQDSQPLEKWPHLDRSIVGPSYFATMRIPILQGREFSEQDSGSAPPVVIVNEAAAKQFWPGQNPLGQKVRFGGEDTYSEVVGVARDGKYRTLGEAQRSFVYRPLAQGGNTDWILIVRIAGDPRPVTGEIRSIARQLDSKVPMLHLQTLEERTAVSLLLPRTGAAFFGLFGLLGLVLASVGLYGVIAYTASQRTHEIGIRMALGARPRQILELIIRQGLTLAALGIVIGLAGAFAATRVLSVILYGVSERDPVTFAGISLGLILIAILACYVPARRAMSVDPMVALRYE